MRMSGLFRKIRRSFSIASHPRKNPTNACNLMEQMFADALNVDDDDALCAKKNSFWVVNA